jgi:hypothetical protein
MIKRPAVSTTAPKAMPSATINPDREARAQCASSEQGGAAA